MIDLVSYRSDRYLRVTSSLPIKLLMNMSTVTHQTKNPKSMFLSLPTT